MEKSVDMSSQVITIYCKILVIQEGQYQVIVVEDLNREYTDDLKYVTVVKLPNWEVVNLYEIGDTGYLQFQYVKAGTTQYFNKELKDFEVYNYTNNYLINFFKEKDLCKQDKFEFE